MGHEQGVFCEHNLEWSPWVGSPGAEVGDAGVGRHGADGDRLCDATGR